MGARLLLLAAGAVLLYIMDKGSILGDSSAPLPADPAGRRARARSAIAAADRYVTTEEGRRVEIPVDWLYFQAQLETGDFKLTKPDGSPSNYAATRSLFNRHRGSGRGTWTGRIHLTANGEDLRIYDSPEQSVRDIMQLYNDRLYKNAAAAVAAGSRSSWYQLVAQGDGVDGFVGKAGTPKAAEYANSLIATANRGVTA